MVNKKLICGKCNRSEYNNEKHLCYGIVPKNIFNSQNNILIPSYVQFVERQKVTSSDSISNSRSNNAVNYYGKRVAISGNYAIFGTAKEVLYHKMVFIKQILVLKVQHLFYNQ